MKQLDELEVALRNRAAMMRAEFHIEVKDVSAADGDIVIRGLASTPEIDRFGDIVEVDAFRGTVGDYMSNGVILLHHDHEKVVGHPAAYDLTSKAFEFEGRIYGGLHPLDVHEQTKHEIKKGMLRALSIGFRILKDERGGGGDSRRITDLELFEISVVSVPANRSTLFNVVRGFTTGSDSQFDLYGKGLPWQTGYSRSVAVNDGDEEANDRLDAARSQLRMARRGAR